MNATFQERKGVFYLLQKKKKKDGEKELYVTPLTCELQILQVMLKKN